MFLKLFTINFFIIFLVQNVVPDQFKDKVDKLNRILQKEEKDIDQLKDLACSEGGLVISKYRLYKFKKCAKHVTRQVVTVNF